MSNSNRRVLSLDKNKMITKLYNSVFEKCIIRMLYQFGLLAPRTHRDTQTYTRTVIQSFTRTDSQRLWSILIQHGVHEGPLGSYAQQNPHQSGYNRGIPSCWNSPCWWHHQFACSDLCWGFPRDFFFFFSLLPLGLTSFGITMTTVTS